MATGSGASVEYVIEALRIFDEGTSSSVDEDSEPKLLPHDAPFLEQIALIYKLILRKCPRDILVTITSWLDHEVKINKSASFMIVLLEQSLRLKTTDTNSIDEQDTTTVEAIKAFMSTCLTLIDVKHTESHDVDGEGEARSGRIHVGLQLMQLLLLLGPDCGSFSAKTKLFLKREAYGRCLSEGLRLARESLVPSQRHSILGHMVGPVLKLPPVGADEEALFDLEAFLHKTTELDLLSQSMILCLLLGDASMKQRLVELIRSDHYAPIYWLLLQRLFMSPESLCRKRAASALQLTLDLLAPSLGDHVDTQSSFIFFRKFLLVFTQLEGVNSTHLFEQVDQLVASLFATVVLAPSADESTRRTAIGECCVLLLEDRSALPAPSFCWLKALFHLLLGLSLPTIRKEAVSKLFSGKWPVNASNVDVQNWVTSELLLQVNSSVYFPPAFALKIAPDSREAKIYPGSQLSQFILQQLGEIGSADSRKRFLQRFVTTLFGEDAPRGALVGTWSTLGFEEDTTSVPEETFDEIHLLLLQRYIDSHLSSTNNALRECLYRGLLPLTVQGACLIENSPEPLVCLLRDVGLHRVTSSPPLLELLMSRLERLRRPSPEDGKLAPYSSILAASAKGDKDWKLAVDFTDRNCLSTSSAVLELASLEQTASRTLVPAQILEHLLKVGTQYASFLFQETEKSNKENSVGEMLHKTKVAAQLLSRCTAGDHHKTLEVVNSFLDSLKSRVTSPPSADTNSIDSIFELMLGVRLSNAFLSHLSLPRLGSAASHLQVLLVSLLDIEESSAAQYRQATQQLQQDRFLEELVFSETGYGKCVSVLVESKWEAVTATLTLLAASGSSVGTLSPANISNYMCVVREKMEMLSVESMPHVLTSLSHIMRLLLKKGEEEAYMGLYHDILEKAWTLVAEGADYIYWPSLLSFVDLLFHPKIASCMDTVVLQELFAKAVELGLNQRPSLLHLLALRLGTLLLEGPTSLLQSLQGEIIRLLIYLREPQVDERQVTNAILVVPTTSASDEKDLSRKAARFIMLSSLERLIKRGKTNTDIQEGVRNLMRSLFAMNARKDFQHQAVVGSDTFIFKLRCWQTMCVLAPVVDEALFSETIDVYFRTLTVPCSTATRTHMEIFGALLTKAFPSTMLPRVLTELRDFNLPQPVLCSLFIVLGFVLFPEDTTSVSKEQAQDIINAVLPWLGTSSGLPRAIALLLLLRLIPLVCDLTQQNRNNSQAYLLDLYRMLNENKEAKKVIKRQQHFFRDYCLDDKDSLRGLLSLPVEPGGEIMPSNLTTVILEVFRSNIIDNNQNWNNQKNLDDVSTPVDTAVGVDEEGLTLQTKIVPFDELKLAVSAEVQARSRNGALRRKQSLVLCASLVDKVTNLAGIARTCEIFAVEKLVVPDMNLTKSETFKGIAVTADNWLDMVEVKEAALLPWLRQMRVEGYAIVGLEQTDSSCVLGDTPLPEKCILLLGKEKEGIPVELLQAVTLCVEIPQFGVIRSLNVHVSAAITIWELTKSNAAGGQLSTI